MSSNLDRVLSWLCLSARNSQIGNILETCAAFEFNCINTPSPGYVAKCAFKTCPVLETAILGQMSSNLERVLYWYCLSAGNSKIGNILETCAAFEFNCINTPSPGYVAKCAFKTCPVVETAISGQMSSNLDRVLYWYCLSAGNSKIGNILETCAAFKFNCINTPSPGYVEKCAFKTCPAVEPAILGQMSSNLDRVLYWYCLSARILKLEIYWKLV